jgi:hypothetical protein
VEAAIWGLIGTVVGALASIGATWLSGHHSMALQQQAKSLDRIECGRAFQRKNLVDLQDALHDAMRMVSRAHFEDLVSFAKGGEWGGSMLSAEVDEGVRLTQRKAAILIERVADDELRSDLKRSMKALTQALLAKSHTEAVAAMEAAGAMAQDTLEHIGRVLRALY